MRLSILFADLSYSILLLSMRCPPYYKVLILVAVIEVAASGTGGATNQGAGRSAATCQSANAWICFKN